MAMLSFKKFWLQVHQNACAPEPAKDRHFAVMMPNDAKRIKRLGLIKVKGFVETPKVANTYILTQHGLDAYRALFKDQPNFYSEEFDADKIKT